MSFILFHHHATASSHYILCCVFLSKGEGGLRVPNKAKFLNEYEITYMPPTKYNSVSHIKLINGTLVSKRLNTHIRKRL